MENDETTSDETQILSMIQRYYSNLYTSQITDAQGSFERFTEGMEIPKLDDAERDALDGPLTYEECKKSLETFENGKSPGKEGFTVEFYTHFFDLVGVDLLASLNGVYEFGRSGYFVEFVDDNLWDLISRKLTAMPGKNFQLHLSASLILFPLCMQRSRHLSE